MAQFLDPDLFAQIGRAIAFIMGHQTDISDEAVAYFERIIPAWTVGENVKKGMVRTYEGTRYRCLQDHACTAEWTPTAAVSLWAKVLPGQEGSGEEIGEWEQPGSTNGYAKGDKVTHNGKTWESLVNNNVWEPGVIGTESVWKEVKA